MGKGRRGVGVGKGVGQGAEGGRACCCQVTNRSMVTAWGVAWKPNKGKERRVRKVWYKNVNEMKN